MTIPVGNISMIVSTRGLYVIIKYRFITQCMILYFENYFNQGRVSLPWWISWQANQKGAFLVLPFIAPLGKPCITPKQNHSVILFTNCGLWGCAFFGCHFVKKDPTPLNGTIPTFQRFQRFQDLCFVHIITVFTRFGVSTLFIIAVEEKTFLHPSGIVLLLLPDCAHPRLHDQPLLHDRRPGPHLSQDWDVCQGKNRDTFYPLPVALCPLHPKYILCQVITILVLFRGPVWKLVFL